MTSLNTVFQRMVAEIWGNRYVIHPSSLNSTSTSTSLVIDGGPITAYQDFTYTGASSNAYDGAYVYFTAGAATVTAPEAEWSRVTRGGFAGSSGTFTLSPALSADPNSVTSTSRLLFMFGLSPFDLLECVNNTIRGLYLPRFMPLTYVPDGSMESSGVTSWTDISAATVTQTKDTTNPVLGKQTLKLTSFTSNGDGVTSDNMPFTEGEQLFASFLVQVTAGALNCALYDATNGAVIHSVTVNEDQFTNVQFPVTVPNDCENVTVRFTRDSASATTAFINYAMVFPTNRPMFDISALNTTDLVDRADVLGVWTQRAGTPSEVNESYVGWAGHLDPWPLVGGTSDYYAGVPHYLEVEGPCDTPLFVEYRDKGTEFTGINATTSETLGNYVPLELVVEGACAEAYEQLMSRTRNSTMQGKYAQKAQHHRRTFTSILNTLDLGQPKPELVTVRRVAV